MTLLALSDAASGTSSDTLSALLPFLPALVYLATACSVLIVLRRIPTLLHPTALVIGLCTRFMVDDWKLLLAPISLAALMFVVLVYFASRTVTGATLFTLTVTVALAPMQAWPWLAACLLVAAVVAGVRTFRASGKDRLSWIAMDTVGALGVTPQGTFKLPEASLVPTRDQLADPEDVNTKGLRMYLPPYLLGGLVAATAVAVLF